MAGIRRTGIPFLRWPRFLEFEILDFRVRGFWKIGHFTNSSTRKNPDTNMNISNEFEHVERLEADIKLHLQIHFEGEAPTGEPKALLFRRQ